MNNNNELVTLFEHLPVHIFFEIFDLLSLKEIKTSFFDLNTHINSIIRSIKCAIHTIDNDDNEAVDILHFFPTQITRLIVTHAKSLDFTSLINLRSLTIERGTFKQLDDIRPKYFPRLEILHIDDNKSRNNLIDI
ncbi:unnamed protein product [Adineta ricciae]|uniref:F-box domain-containing protein n=1 Tax=Adineta ricciae TaxID=249248 RepID=A0A815N6Q4_ADIRI|nr:unnamed protein product [Adineta ricciae]CAF1432487.1 unnamed protein product [Adineta ricciae]